MWPGLFIPPVPPKKLVVGGMQGSGKVEVVEDRRLILEEFLKKTAENQALLHSEVFQDFLKQDRFAPNITEPAFTPELITRYCEHFPQYDKPTPDNITELLLSQKRFLTSSLEAISSLRSVAKSAAALYTTLGTVNATVATSAQNVETTYLEKNLGLYVSPDADMSCNPFSLVRDWSHVEVHDLKAMLEACHWLQEAETYRKKVEGNYHVEQANLHKLQGGKMSLSLLFKPKAGLITTAEQRAVQVNPSSVRTGTNSGRPSHQDHLQPSP